MRKWILTCLLLTLLAGTASAEIVPMGSAIGIRMQTEGVVVVSVEREDSAIRAGDIITAVDGKQVQDAAQLQEAVRGRREVSVALRRGGAEKTVRLDTRTTDEGTKLGLYVRDSMAGIGTLTYYDTQTGRFGALGHGVSEVTSGQLLPLSDGQVLYANVTKIERGEPGAPGRLGGTFDLDSPIGAVEQNTECGIFGRLYETPEGSPAELAKAKRGPAEILATVEGNTVQSYTVEITQADAGARHGLRLTVTDPALLEKTGGIIQGISGAPILQDGKLVGAVTHVLVGDPTKGYGIPIQKMLAAAA